MVSIKTKEEISIIQEGSEILNKTHGVLADQIAPGVTTKFLDTLAEEFIRDHHAKSSFKGYNGYPFTLCIAVNNVVVHGFPSKYVLKSGDIISVDCGVYYKGYHTDSAYTYAVGKVDKNIHQLLSITKKSLYCGIKQAVVGNTVGDIGYAIQSLVESNGYAVVRTLSGHGIGKNLHEDPPIPNFGKKKQGPILKNGMVIAIEPIVNLGHYRTIEKKNGIFTTWDGKPSAHFEHTVAILQDGPQVLTSYKYIEQKIKSYV